MAASQRYINRPRGIDRGHKSSRLGLRNENLRNTLKSKGLELGSRAATTARAPSQPLPRPREFQTPKKKGEPATTDSPPRISIRVTPVQFPLQLPFLQLFEQQSPLVLHEALLPPQETH